RGTVVARGKMAELEQKFEDEGFRDLDQTLDGDFDDAGHPDFKWKAEVVKPDVNLSPEQLLGMFAGAGGKDASGNDIIAKLMGKLGGGGPAAGAAAAASPLAGMLQASLTQFGEQLKKTLRE